MGTNRKGSETQKKLLDGRSQRNKRRKSGSLRIRGRAFTVGARRHKLGAQDAVSTGILNFTVLEAKN